MRYLQSAGIQSRYSLRHTPGSRHTIHPAHHPGKKDHIILPPTPAATVMDFAKDLRWSPAGCDAFQFILCKEAKVRAIRRPERRHHTFRARQRPASERVERAHPEQGDSIHSGNERYTSPIGRKHCTAFHSVENICSILRWRDREANHVRFGRLPAVDVNKRESRSNERHACCEGPSEQSPSPSRPFW